MVKLSRIWLTLAIIFTTIFLAWGTVRAVRSIQFDMQCKSYLKLAADANSVELAKENLEKAINYAEKNNLTEGIIGIIFKDPINDVGFWYNNMKACYAELDNLPDDATSLEKTNVLMKLRESLVDVGESTVVTLPTGISVYPYNVLFCIWGWLSLILACVFWFMTTVEWDY